MSKENSNIFANAAASGKAQRLITVEKYNRIISCGDFFEAAKMVSEAGYGEEINDKTGFEKCLRAEEKKLSSYFSELCSDESAVQCFLLRYDYLNLKQLMKCKYMRIVPPELSECGVYPVKILVECVNSDRYDPLEREMKEACEAVDLAFFEGNRTSRTIDVTLDLAMCRNIARLKTKCRSAIIREYLTYEIDAINFMTYLRAIKGKIPIISAQSQFAEGGTVPRERFDLMFGSEADKFHLIFEGSALHELSQKGAEALFSESNLIAVAAQIHQNKRKLLEPYRYNIEGIEPLVCYYLSRRVEINNLRLILTCLKNSVTSNEIQKRIKNLYV